MADCIFERYCGMCFTNISGNDNHQGCWNNYYSCIHLPMLYLFARTKVSARSLQGPLSSMGAFFDHFCAKLYHFRTYFAGADSQPVESLQGP